MPMRRALLSLAAAGLTLPLASAAARGDIAHSFIFGLPPEIVTNGATAVQDFGVYLTTAGGQAGSLWHQSKQTVTGGFVTTFRFRIDPGPAEFTGDGFAFVLQDSTAGTGALGGPGSDMAYTGIQRSVAVEFDTFFCCGEFDGPHVAIQTRGEDGNGTGPNATLEIADLSDLNIDIADGREHTAVIQYVPPVEPADGSLSVYVDEVFVLSVPLDFTAVLAPGNVDFDDLTDEDGKMYVGFTGATGGADSRHRLDDWSFEENTGQCREPGTYVGLSGQGAPGSTFTAISRMTGSRPLTFVWSHDGEQITDDDSGRIRGLGTGSLFIDNIGFDDEGEYTVTATGTCGSHSDGPFVLDLFPACNLADITEIGGTTEAPGNPDNQLTVDDIIVFINMFSDGLGCPGPNPPFGPACSQADITGIGGPPELPDGQLTVDDIIAFFNAFSDGC